MSDDVPIMSAEEWQEACCRFATAVIRGDERQSEFAARLEAHDEALRAEVVRLTEERDSIALAMNALDEDCAAAESEVARLTEERDELRTWDGIMAFLDAEYPADVFDGSSGDPGPRIVVLMREVARLRAALAHGETEVPNWETKFVCECGERFASKFTFYQHLADALTAARALLAVSDTPAPKEER